MTTPPSTSSLHDGAFSGVLAAVGGDGTAFLKEAFAFAAQTTPFFDSPDASKALARLLRDVQQQRKAVDKRIEGVDAAAPAAAAVAAATPAAASAPANLAAPPAAEASTSDDDADADADAAIDPSSSTTIKPNTGNGADLPTYSWTQTLAEVVVTIPLAGSGPGGRLRATDCAVSISRTALSAGLKGAGATPVLAGTLTAAVQPDECVWSVVDGRALEVTLAKVDAMRWWGAVVEGEPAIDTTAVEPESSKLGDLDGETRATVEKMMWDQRQKALGLPTSDEAARAETLKKFMAAHPELDFSNAKISP